jgi:hypothetical protein
VYTSYASGTYAPPATTGTPIVPGAGFFWLFYNRDITAAELDALADRYGEGTSASYELTNSAFHLALTNGTPAVIASSGNPVPVTLPQSADGFYMIGNPFVYPLDLSGVSVTAGGSQFQNTYQAWQPTVANPSTGTYVPRGINEAVRVLSPWQGVFAEQATSTGAVTVAYDPNAIVPTSTVSLVGRSGSAAGVTFTLSGETSTGVPVGDEAAIVRLVDGASLGWDLDDATKLVPPTAEFALVAPVGTRGDLPVRQAVLSLPPDASTPVVVPITFTATHAGTYTLTAAVTGLPESWTSVLSDLVTGTVASFNSPYTFTSEATGWTERFTLTLRPGGATAGEPLPSAVRTLSAPTPNPSSGRARLVLRLPTPEHVTATVVDAIGRTVQTVYDGEAGAEADVALDVDATRLAPGVYVVRVQGITFADVRRLTVVR